MVELTPTETKLLRLMLDSAAQLGEVSGASTKLAESLRRRNVTSQDVEEALTSGGRPDYGLCRMPFGRSKNQLFRDISPFELRNAQKWAAHTPELAAKFALTTWTGTYGNKPGARRGERVNCSGGF